jgi:hypothetical protein
LGYCAYSNLTSQPGSFYLELTHGTVNHSQNEYVRAYFWYTNTVENYFSMLKRGIIGTFHQISEAHLHRYSAESDFRYNARKRTDANRMALSILGIVGKRLIYPSTNGQAHMKYAGTLARPGIVNHRCSVYSLLKPLPAIRPLIIFLFFSKVL